MLFAFHVHFEVETALYSGTIPQKVKQGDRALKCTASVNQSMTGGLLVRRELLKSVSYPVTAIVLACGPGGQLASGGELQLFSYCLSRTVLVWLLEKKKNPVAVRTELILKSKTVWLNPYLVWL